MSRIRKDQRELKLIIPKREELKKGLTVSKLALSSPESIALTPYTKNMLNRLDRKDKLEVGDPETRMEAYIETETRKILERFVGKRMVKYDTKSDPWDKKLYSVDCWRNFKEGVDIRHAVPGMNEKRQVEFLKFSKPIKDFDLITMLHRDSDLVKAVNFVMSNLPDVKATEKWEEVSLPFQRKHTNVGYPYYGNDQRVENGKTLAELTSEQARKMSPEQVAGYPSVAFGRNLRAKPRPILGGSRIQALVYNQLEHPEILAYKEKSPFFFGYNDDSVLRQKMMLTLSFLMSHRGLTCKNRDYHTFDLTVFPDLRRLVAAISEMKAQDVRGKDIAHWRGVSQFSTYLVNGYSNSVKRIFGRIFSGEIDTNRGGGLANAIMDIWATLKQMPDWIETVANPLISSGSSPLWVMGDDNLLVQPYDFNDRSYEKFIAKFGLEVSSEKGEYGLFFLQRRLFKDGNDTTFITPFTRIIRSMATKEMKKGLGPVGWTYASYQLLYQLIEWPELMVAVAKIFAPFDEYRLGTNWSVSQMKNLIAAEDKEAKRKDPKALTTVERLFDGDPLKAKFFEDTSQSGPISQVHALLSKALLRG